MKHKYSRCLPEQLPNVPEILPCKVCGSNGKLEEDWDFRDLWKVYCPNRCYSTPDCGNVHRAISRWNNKNN